MKGYKYIVKKSHREIMAHIVSKPGTSGKGKRKMRLTRRLACSRSHM